MLDDRNIEATFPKIAANRAILGLTARRSPNVELGSERSSGSAGPAARDSSGPPYAARPTEEKRGDAAAMEKTLNANDHWYSRNRRLVEAATSRRRRQALAWAVRGVWTLAILALITAAVVQIEHQARKPQLTHLLLIE